MYIWVALKESVKFVKDNVTNYTDMFESRISAGAKENDRPELQGNLMTWKVTQRNVWKEIANLHIKRVNNYTIL